MNIQIQSLTESQIQQVHEMTLPSRCAGDLWDNFFRDGYGINEPDHRNT